MKRRLVVSLILTLLVSALAGSLFVNLAAARITSDIPATITIQLPENKAYTGSDIPVAFTIEIPQPAARYGPVPESYSYFLDGKKESFWPSEVSGSSPSYTCKATLLGLAEGSHRLSISVGLSYFKWWLIGSISGVSQEVVFTVDTAVPHILILSLTPYETYNVTSLPLEFTVSEPVNWLGYSLDGEETVTITGNTTLHGLSEGSHSVVVHAEDTAGSTGSSRLVTFEVDTETEADSTDSTESGSFPTTLVIAVVIVVSVAIVGFGLLAYFIRRNRRRSK